MEIIEIEGSVNEKSKELKFDVVRPVIAGENRTTILKITLPESLQDSDIYLEFKTPDRKRYVSQKLDVADGIAQHKLLNITLSKAGQLAVQLTCVIFAGENTEVFKSKINTQITISEGINAGEEITEENPDIIAQVQRTIDEADAVKNQLLQDKDNGLFKGEKDDDGIVDYSKTVTEYDETFTYGFNSYCYYNGKLYKSLQADNIGNNPETEYWEEAYYSKTYIDSVLGDISSLLDTINGEVI